MVDIAKYIPANTTEIVSGGARGVDTLAEHWADQNNIPKVIFKPDYKRHGRAAPIKRNVLIVEAADLVGCSYKAMRRRLEEAMRRLRGLLGQRLRS